MSLWVLVGFTGVGVYVCYRWLATPTGFPPVLAGFTIAGMIVSGGVEASHRWQEHQYSTIASTLAGREAHVHCQRLSAAMFNVFGPEGFVPYNQAGQASAHIHLKWQVCHDLLGYRFGPKTNPADSKKVAVHILTHEAMHVSGDIVEASAECKAIQHNTTTAQALGASKADADMLARWYFTTYYPRLNPNYVSADCAAGGPMDLHVPTAPWSTR